jgi:hypothetical protein
MSERAKSTHRHVKFGSGKARDSSITAGSRATSSFGAQQWTWNEAKEEWSPSFRKVVIESYSVDARQLATPVRAGKHSITFECRASKCIKVIGSSATTVADGTPKQETTEVEKAQNTWFFASAAEAKRVAQALNRGLKLLGAKPRAF